MTGTSSMRRHDRPALRVQSLKSVAQDQVRALCNADVIELRRRWPAEATCRVPGCIDATQAN
jgi:hypothetical protein